MWVHDSIVIPSLPRDLVLALTCKFHTFPARSADSTTSIGRNGDPPLCSVFTQRHRRITVSTNPGGTLHASDSKKCEICGLEREDKSRPWNRPLRVLQAPMRTAIRSVEVAPKSLRDPFRFRIADRGELVTVLFVQLLQGFRRLTLVVVYALPCPATTP